jgi:predicted AAA+ superfamily ATPase
VAFDKIKVVAAGSSSITFSQKNTGVDRTKKIVLETLDFNEYLLFTQKEKTLENFEHFLGTGGFPGHINKVHDFQKMLNDTLKPILIDDLPSVRKGVDSISIIRLIKELALLTNGEVNVSNLEQKTGISRVTIGKYIDILDDLLLLKKIYRVDSRGSFGKKREFKIFLNPHFQL